MKVLHAGILAATYGGPAMSTYLTLRGLREAGVEAELIQYPLAEGESNRGDDIPIHYSHRPWERRLCFTPAYRRDILALGDYDLYHAQGVWLWHTYALASAARRAGRPYLITPRGMLYPQDIAKASTGLKRLSLRLRLLSDLNRAACVHVTCADELRHCRDLGITSPIAVIPNPVEVRPMGCEGLSGTTHNPVVVGSIGSKGASVAPQISVISVEVRSIGGKGASEAPPPVEVGSIGCKESPCAPSDAPFRLGYLGRLSPRKHVEHLLVAMADVAREAPEAELLIIGGGDADYEARLRAEAARLGLRRVTFAGFLTGEARERALSTCSVLALPSEFENLGNVILEGLERAVPCIATQGSPWKELHSWRCGWWVPYGQEHITEAVRAALHTSSDDLRQMGLRGRQLVAHRYSVEAVASRMKALYEWLTEGGERPDFVSV